jgi:nucleoside-diphosphate-sugar epimerase
MNVLISGGSGFIGTALTRSLLADGHNVWVLTRNPARTRLPEGAQPVRWDGRTSQGWIGVFSQMDAVVNGRKCGEMALDSRAQETYP